MLETAVRPQEFYSIHSLYALCVIGIRVSVLSILNMVPAIFVAPYGCSWANQNLASPNMLSVSLYRAWFIHTFLFTGKTMFKIFCFDNFLRAANFYLYLLRIP